MMTDKERIEEMAREIESAKRVLWNAVNRKDDSYDWHSRGIAQHLLGMGYRKIPEGSVVLSEKEKTDLYVEAWNKGFAHGRKETAREILTKIGKHLKRYSHIHKLAEEARESKEEYADGTPVEMCSVWEVITLKKNGYDDYETMHELEKNISNLALSRLLQELEKDFRLFVRELGVEVEE